MKKSFTKTGFLLLIFFLMAYFSHAQDAGVTQLLSPQNLSCGQTNGVIKVIVYNYGSTTISNIPVTFSATGPSSISLTDTLKKNISAGKQDTLIFRTTINSAAGGIWQYKIWSVLSGDKNHSNDTLGGNITINSIPPSPTGSAASRCEAGLVTFKASSSIKGGKMYWFDSSTATTPFAKGDSISVNLSATTTYYAAVTSGVSFDSISTTFSGSTSKMVGNMFNVNAKNDVTIDSFDVDFAAKSNDTVFVYYKMGTYSGYQTNSSAWTYVGKYFVKPASALAPARAVIGGLSLSGGNLYGFYVTRKAGSSIAKLAFLGETSSSTDSATNSNLTIYSGDALTGFFTGPTSSYYWNGRIYYSAPGCLGTMQAITGTITPVVKSLKFTKDKTSAGALYQGTSANPDQICVNDSLKYDMSVPSNFLNSDYGTKWRLSFTLKTVKGYATTNYKIVYPSSTTNGLISFFPKSSDGDSVYILTGDATNMVSGCDSIFTRYININPVPKAGFSVSNVCFGQTAPFTNTATPAGQLLFLWALGNGDTLSGANQGALYRAPGTYTITQIAFNLGCRASTTRSITIYNAPFGANFKTGTPFMGQFNGGDFPTPDYACVGDTDTYQIIPPKGLSNSDYGSKWVIASISLKTLSGSGPYSKDTATKFPTGGNSATFSFHPTKDGDSLFILKMSIKTLPGNCDSVISRYIKVSVKPSTNFTFTNNCMGTPLTFTDKSTTLFFTSVSGWIWDFGDGTVSTLQNPTHSYAKAGIYTVKLTASSTEGCGSTVSRTVQQYPAPTIKFGLLNECSNHATSFLDSSSIPSGSTIKGWAWDFGDASTSSLKSPSHVYTSSGTYTVNLVETSSFGCVDTLSKTLIILKSPVAGFNYKNACTGTSINFSNTSTGSIGAPKYAWDFGTGSFSSNTTNPSYTFALNGKYNMRLVVISGDGCTDTSYQVITPYPKPIVLIGYTNACVGMPVSYADTGTNDGNSVYTWKYGDKDSDQLTMNSASHSYTNAGTYNVSLSVQNANACIDSAKASIAISPFPVADFKASDICINKQPETFTNTSTGTGTLNFTWDLGDNSKTATTTNVTHTYSIAGTYTVQLITTNASGCADTVSKPININPTPVILPWAQNANHNIVSFVPQDTTIGSFKWYFGDPNHDSSSQKIPTFNYPPVKGKYQVKLYVTNQFGCVSEKADSLSVSSSGIEQQMSNLSGIKVFPNPFEGVTHINYQLQSRSMVNINVFDLAGKQVAQLKNGFYEAGQYSDIFDANKCHCPDGVYILKMTVNGTVYTKRIENTR